MSVLFILGLMLIVVFSFSVSTYITCFKTSIESLIGKLFLIAFLGILFTALTFTVSLALIWPPVM